MLAGIKASLSPGLEWGGGAYMGMRAAFVEGGGNQKKKKKGRWEGVRGSLLTVIYSSNKSPLFSL